VQVQKGVSPQKFFNVAFSRPVEANVEADVCEVMQGLLDHLRIFGAELAEVNFFKVIIQGHCYLQLTSTKTITTLRW
jgi:hypothetical protein